MAFWQMVLRKTVEGNGTEEAGLNPESRSASTPRQESGLHYPHVALYSGAGAEPTFLTQGELVVTEILAWLSASDGGLVYFMATEPEAPGARSDNKITQHKQRKQQHQIRLHPT